MYAGFSSRVGIYKYTEFREQNFWTRYLMHKLSSSELNIHYTNYQLLNSISTAQTNIYQLNSISTGQTIIDWTYRYPLHKLISIELDIHCIKYQRLCSRSTAQIMQRLDSISSTQAIMQWLNSISTTQTTSD